MTIRFMRRSFLTALGATAASLPFLRPAAVLAQVPPRRVVFFVKPLGVQEVENFYPSTDDDMSAAEGLEALAPVKDKIIALRGLENHPAMLDGQPPDHQPDYPSLLTGRRATGGQSGGAGISIDQRIAEVANGNTRFRSLHLGVRSGNILMTYSRAGVAVPHDNDPYVVRSRIFSDLGLSDAAFERLSRARRSVLDLVSDEVRALECQIGAEHRESLDAHHATLRDLERTLAQAEPTTEACASPNIGAGIDVEAEVETQRTARAQIDIAAMALACDLTRVVTFHFGKSKTVPWVSGHGFVDWHDDVHRRAGVGRGDTAIVKWYVDQFAYLLSRLDAVDEANGTLLDNTAVVLLHEQGRTSNHGRGDYPILIGGGCGGFLRTGLRRNYGGRPGKRPSDITSGVPSLSSLHLTLAHAMGLTDERFGDESIASDPLSDIVR